MTDIARVHGRQSTDEDSSRIPAFAFLAQFSFAYTGTSAQSAPVTDASIKAATPYVLVRLCATTDCWIAFGDNPVAAAGAGVFLPAGVVDVWRMTAGNRVAAIQAASGGSLSVVILE